MEHGQTLTTQLKTSSPEPYVPSKAHTCPLMPNGIHGGLLLIPHGSGSTAKCRGRSFYFYQSLLLPFQGMCKVASPQAWGKWLDWDNRPLAGRWAPRSSAQLCQTFPADYQDHTWYRRWQMIHFHLARVLHLWNSRNTSQAWVGKTASMKWEKPKERHIHNKKQCIASCSQDPLPSTAICTS